MGNVELMCPCFHGLDPVTPAGSFGQAKAQNKPAIASAAPARPFDVPNGSAQRAAGAPGATTGRSGGGRSSSSTINHPRVASFRSGASPQEQKGSFELKYELFEVLGIGSTSEVRRCRERGPARREFACKIIDKTKVHEQYSTVMQIFENEIEILMRLQQMRRHPNIIYLEDVFETEDKIIMVMEHMKGGELFDYVVDRGTLSEEEASNILRKITSAVAHMHSQGIIHRDLKPENLLLTDIGPGAEVKIIDFGLSKMLPDTQSHNTQSFLGTRGYLAPEMLKRQAYSASVDVWALGVIAFILLCGCLPFDDDSAQISDEAAKAKFCLRFPEWAEGISPEAKGFLAMLLNPDARKRVTSTQALEHPWLGEAALMGTPDRKKLLASPKHLRSVPRTPQRGGTPQRKPPPRNSPDAGGLEAKGHGGGGSGRGGGGGIGAAVGGGFRSRAGSF